MGRGRLKAKQTKVARELKYNTPPTDLNALQRELAGKSSDESREEEQYQDPYDEYEDEYRR